MVVGSANQTVNWLKSVDCFQKHTVVAHGEVAAFNQRNTQVTRKVGVFKVSFVVWPRSQQGNARAVSLGRKPADAIDVIAVKTGQMLNVHFTKTTRKAARNTQAVFKGITETRRRLHAVGNHPPFPIGAAPKVECHHV